MPTLIFIMFIGLLGGIAVGFQGPLAAVIGQRLGFIESAFIVHLGGAIGALLILLPRAGGALNAWRGVPWYALLAGLLGIMVVVSINTTIPRLGAAGMVMMIVIGQLVVSAAIDHFGLLGNAVRPVDVMRIAGFVVMGIGVWLVVR